MPYSRRSSLGARAMFRSALRTLADRAGILPDYVDQTGAERHVTSDETRVALLAGMGIDAGDASAAARALEEMEERDAERVLTPVCVLERGPPRSVNGRGRPPAVSAAAPPEWGRAVEWALELRAEDGTVHRADGRARRAAARGEVPVPLPAATPLGYHALTLTLRARGNERTAEQTLILAPPSCPRPRDVLHGQRVFGLTVNLYSVRSDRNWGAGDFTDLGELLGWAREIGAAFVGVNPLHALRNRGGDVSPYSPVSRLFRNALYLDVELVPELAQAPSVRDRLASETFRAELARLRHRVHVDYEAVMRLKRPALEALHRVFVDRHRSRGDARGRAYEKYVQSQGQALEDFATFCALEEEQGRGARGEGRGSAWREWPAEFRDARSPEVAAFRGAQAERVDFHRWLQFELDRQLAVAAERGRDLALPIGLYQDLAIGSAPSGSDAWAFPSLFAAGVSIGAPPDPYAAAGQNWGLPPLDPHRLAETGYRYWIQLVRSALRHAGALRIDHVMGLFRQFWIPEGKSGKEGAYVRFPADDLLGILALESTRSGALVVGEDLGTVPEEVPPALDKWGVLSSKVLYFERDKRGDFTRARDYARLALATANTHDMATLAGFWCGRDVELRRSVGLIASDKEERKARAERVVERDALVRRLQEEAILPEGEEPGSDLELRAAVHAFLRRTPSWLVGLSLDDLAGETDPVNVPGVGPDKFQSWTRRLSASLESLRTDANVTRALGAERVWIP